MTVSSGVRITTEYYAVAKRVTYIYGPDKERCPLYIFLKPQDNMYREAFPLKFQCVQFHRSTNSRKKACWFFPPPTDAIGYRERLI